MLAELAACNAAFSTVKSFLQNGRSLADCASQIGTIVASKSALEEKEKEQEPATLAEQFPAEEENESESEPTTEEAQTEQAEGGSTDTALDERKNVSLAKTFDKIDQQIKDVDKNLKVKNIIKINAMIDNSILLTYNVPFYKPKDIYLDQLNMQDNRQIYVNVSLASYVENDKITINKKKLNEIQFKKRQILLELERLRNG